MNLKEALDATQALSEHIVKPDSELGTFGKIGKAALRKMCDAYSTSPGPFGPPGGPSDAQYSQVCKPYFQEQGYEGPSVVPPDFQGGQCVGIAYIFTFRATDIFGSPPSTITKRVLGPVGPITFQDQTAFGSESRIFYITQGVGQAFQANLQVASLAKQGGSVPSCVVTGVQREDGLADNCGSLNETVRPGTAPVVNFGDTNVVNIDGRNYNIKIDSPVTNNVDKSVTVPILINGDVKLSVGGSGGSVSEPAPVANGNPPVISAPEIPQSESEENNGEFGDPPSGYEYVGAYVEVLSYQGPAGGITAMQPRQIWPFTIGNANLLYATSGVSRIVEGNKQIREDAFVLVRPEAGLKVIGCKVALSYPGTYRITPLMVEKESEDA